MSAGAHESLPATISHVQSAAEHFVNTAHFEGDVVKSNPIAVVKEE